MPIFPGELDGLSPTDKFKKIYYQEARLFDKAFVFAKDKKWRPLWAVLGWIMRLVTGGKVKDQQSSYITTLGNFIFYPAGWDIDKADEHDCAALRHELCHVEQYKHLGLGSVWLGFFVFLLLYLSVFLPAGLAWYRWRFERKAYKAGWDAAKEFKLKWKPNLELYIDAMTGPRYVWSWPFKKSVRKWFYKNCT
jgi:hypothetical protein